MLQTGEAHVSERAKTNSRLAKTKKQKTLYWIGYWDGQDSVLNTEDD